MKALIALAALLAGLTLATAPVLGASGNPRPPTQAGNSWLWSTGDFHPDHGWSEGAAPSRRDADAGRWTA